MSWDLRFFDPIPVPGGKPLVKLRDAGANISALPKEDHDRAAWQSAIFVLIHAADKGEPIEFARLGMVQALNPKPESV